MADTISVMAAQPWTIAASQFMAVDDSGLGAPRDKEFPVGTYRPFLATAVATNGFNGGSESDPHEPIAYLAWLLNDSGSNALWTAALQSDGRVKITYLGTGTGTVTWDGNLGVANNTSLLLRYLFGFDANVSLTQNQSVTGTYQVTHAAFVVAGRANSTGWNLLPKRSAIAETDDGLAAAITASRVRRVYTADWRFAPYDWATRTTLGASGTPYLPTRRYRLTQPSGTPYTTTTVAGDAADTTHAVSDPPWSLLDFFSTVHGKRCAIALGNFQAMVAGTDTAGFDTGTFAKSTLQAETPVRPSAPDWSQRVDWPGVTFRYAGHGSR